MDMTIANFAKYRKMRPYLRYGQAFCNFFNVNNPKLYYMSDEKMAKAKVQEYIENWQLT